MGHTAAKRNVALVGMMGAGKTTVGALLAEKLGWTFLDTDLMLEAAFRMPVQRIFEEAGEAAFRSSERLVVRLLASATDSVIATGGGVWVAPEARERLTDFAYSVYLSAPASVLWSRIMGQGTELRPLLAEHDPRRAFEAMLLEREPVYTLADARVDVGRSEPEAVAQQILRKMKSAGLVARPGRAA